MLTFKLIEVKNGYYHYEIYPEDKVENKGEIVFNPETSHLKKKVIPNSPFDCMAHFFNNVKDRDGKFREEGMVAWY